MKLLKILNGIKYELIKGNLDIDISDISYNSKEIKNNYIFVCLIGLSSDGHNYIKEAIKNGATCIITCKDVDIEEEVTIIKVDDTRTKLSYISANFFEHPSDKLIKIGITGTKGKTSISMMLKSILEENNERVGVIGTIGVFINKKHYNSLNTTPESYYIQKYMRMMVDEEIKYLIIEASSSALKAGRVNNIVFDYSIFSNISMDHVGNTEHPTFKDYVNSKMLIFNQSKSAIVNRDIKEFDYIKSICRCPLISYGKSSKSDYLINNIELITNNFSFNTKFALNGKINDEFEVTAPGVFSAYNAASAIICSTLLNIDLSTIKKGLKHFHAKGRYEIININNKFNVIIDFAHNGASIESILRTMKSYPHNNIITLFGCSGGRNKKIRYELGKASAKYSDLSIITMDNPKEDDIDDINIDIASSIIENNGKFKIINDRKEAIEYALSIAKENDIVLLLGKGHENYQKIKGEKIPFNERKIVEDFILK